MSGQERWIVIPHWDADDEHRGFQHYTDRDPIWIKNYRDLLARDEYLTLNFHLRGVLHGLWLEYAASNRRIRDVTLTLTRRLGQRVTTRDLERLNDAGFIVFSDSAPLARCYPRVEKKRKEKALSAHAPTTNGTDFATQVARASTREHHPYDPPTNPAATIRRQITLGVITTTIDLEAELTALHINGTTADELRALIAA